MSDIEQAILELLQIVADNTGDEYEPGPVLTVGGGANNYVVRSPFNTESEFCVIGALMAAASGNGSIVISSSNPGIAAPAGNSFGLVSQGEDNNAFDGYVLPISTTLSPILIEHWQPLGRGVNIYVLVSGVSGFALIAFRRKLIKYLPDKPRVKPATHTHPQSQAPLRRLPAQSTMVAGYESKYPLLGEKVPYQQRGRRMIPERNLGVVPETQDTGNLGKGKSGRDGRSR